MSEPVLSHNSGKASFLRGQLPYIEVSPKDKEYVAVETKL